MPYFTNRYTRKALVTQVLFFENHLEIETTIGKIGIHKDQSTERIAVDMENPYLIEFDLSHNMLTGLIGPDNTIYFKLNDIQIAKQALTVEFSSKITKDREKVNPEDVLEDMMRHISEPLQERFSKLNPDYLDKYYIYEVKVSYLASNPPKPYLFDPTPDETNKALALWSFQSADYPPLLPVT